MDKSFRLERMGNPFMVKGKASMVFKSIDKKGFMLIRTFVMVSHGWHSGQKGKKAYLFIEAIVFIFSFE
jgi:hypothetical protein